jgi:hypothetical protein
MKNRIVKYSADGQQRIVAQRKNKGALWSLVVWDREKGAVVRSHSGSAACPLR